MTHNPSFVWVFFSSLIFGFLISVGIFALIRAWPGRIKDRNRPGFWYATSQAFSTLGWVNAGFAMMGFILGVPAVFNLISVIGAFAGWYGGYRNRKVGEWLSEQELYPVSRETKRKEEQ